MTGQAPRFRYYSRVVVNVSPQTAKPRERERDFMGLCCDLTLVAAAAAAAADLGLSGCRAVQPGDLLKQYLM